MVRDSFPDSVRYRRLHRASPNDDAMNDFILFGGISKFITESSIAKKVLIRAEQDTMFLI